MSEARYVTEANFLITVAKWLHASGSVQVSISRTQWVSEASGFRGE